MNGLLFFIAQVVRLKSPMTTLQKYDFKFFVGQVISFLLIYLSFEVIFKNELEKRLLLGKEAAIAAQTHQEALK